MEKKIKATSLVSSHLQTFGCKVKNDSHKNLSGRFVKEMFALLLLCKFLLFLYDVVVFLGQIFAI